MNDRHLKLAKDAGVPDFVLIPLHKFDKEYSSFDSTAMIEDLIKHTEKETIKLCIDMFTQYLNWVPARRWPGAIEGMTDYINKHFGINDE